MKKRDIQVSRSKDGGRKVKSLRIFLVVMIATVVALSLFSATGIWAETPPLKVSPPPSYNPGDWNFVPPLRLGGETDEQWIKRVDDEWSKSIQRNNNCYNYACNKKTDTFAQPGKAGNYTPANGWKDVDGDTKPDPGHWKNVDINYDEFKKAAQADGLTLILENQPCPEGKFKKALVIAEHIDFHWYREDADGTWSHKPGQTEATNRSKVPGDKNNTIDNVDEVKKDAKARGYEFCATFCCDNNADNVTIAGLMLEPIQPDGTLLASMDVFSGRVNPEWTIANAGNISTLKGFLQDLPTTSWPDWPQLGWTGVTIINRGVDDFPPLVHVFTGVVEVYTNEGIRYYEDLHGMEAWLLEHMPDWDGDGLPSLEEVLGPWFTDPTSPDTDGDYVSDGATDPDGAGPIVAGPDNCPTVYNPCQNDTNGDGVGDACEEISDGGCFIATAAYGTPMVEEIQILREFRDEYLLTNPVGQTFVDFYYRTSPPIAEFITEHPGLKPIVRAGLVPAVAMSTVAVNTTPVEKTAIIGLLVLVSVAAVLATRRRGRGPEHT